MVLNQILTQANTASFVVSDNLRNHGKTHDGNPWISFSAQNYRTLTSIDHKFYLEFLKTASVTIGTQQPNTFQ